MLPRPECAAATRTHTPARLTHCIWLMGARCCVTHEYRVCAPVSAAFRAKQVRKRNCSACGAPRPTAEGTGHCVGRRRRSGSCWRHCCRTLTPVVWSRRSGSRIPPIDSLLWLRWAGGDSERPPATLVGRPECALPARAVTALTCYTYAFCGAHLGLAAFFAFGINLR